VTVTPGRSHAILLPVEVEEVMTERTFEIRVEWDAQASVWIATSDDVPGLCCEATTLEQLLAEIEPLAPELLVANGVLPESEVRQVPLRVIIERRVVPGAAA
jgi:predicted RNase H-like HicB family nuclease